ncbi:MAG: SRPBCC domain-containing protein [Bacteroidetes bacterium]|nr:SRPBCC domain-containing protein [Bacteroidota bacterium]
MAATGKLVPDLVLTRILDAPRDLVFKVWTDPLHVQNWWGPHGFTNPVCEVDIRPGGALRITMRGPDGVLYPGGGTFHEIIEPERIVFTATAFEDESGVPKLEVLNTVTFVEEGGRTTLTLTAVVVKSTPEIAEALAGMEAGWSQSLEKFAAEVAEAAGGWL